MYYNVVIVWTLIELIWLRWIKPNRQRTVYKRGSNVAKVFFLVISLQHLLQGNISIIFEKPIATNMCICSLICKLKHDPTESVTIASSLTSKARQCDASVLRNRAEQTELQKLCDWSCSVCFAIDEDQRGMCRQFSKPPAKLPCKCRYCYLILSIPGAFITCMNVHKKRECQQMHVYACSCFLVL